ncbi:MAG: exopolysaccharide biosynthesis polyprenyl glycosylphosphotransferase [Psychroserpens sp.]|jgi:exopolysaccharide biosynthesis polyprenyl glycosylphosphotransferase
MSKHRYSILFKPLSIFADIFCLNFAYIIAYYFKFQTLETVFSYPYAIIFVLINVFWLGLLILKNQRISRNNQNIYSRIYKFSQLFVVHIGIITFCWINIKRVEFSREHIFLSYSMLFLLGILWRIIALQFLAKYRRSGNNQRKFATTGDISLSKFITSFYEFHPEIGYSFVGHYDNEQNRALEDLIKKEEIDFLYCCTSDFNNLEFKSLIQFSQPYAVELKILPDFRAFLLKSASVEYHDYIPVISISKNPYSNKSAERVKKVFDVTFSIIALLLVLPFLLVIGLITKTTSEGPIFYKQERIGRWGKPFNIYKFRSMYINSEEGGPKLSQGYQDNRITKWGRFMRKTRIDELPQFFNVLKGDMSLVGPRPERQFFIDQIIEKAPEYLKLLSIKPGITSLGQVQYGYAANVEEMLERMEFDLLYLKNNSIETDLYLLYQTTKVILKAKGQ